MILHGTSCYPVFQVSGTEIMQYGSLISKVIMYNTQSLPSSTMSIYQWKSQILVC